MAEKNQAYRKMKEASDVDALIHSAPRSRYVTRIDLESRIIGNIRENARGCHRLPPIVLIGDSTAIQRYDGTRRL